MNTAYADVSTSGENTGTMPYPQAWQSSIRVCAKCNHITPDELMLLCRKHGGTHIHMQCFWNLKSYESRSSGNVLKDVKVCPHIDCHESFRICYNGSDVVFPVSKSQRILFILNPIIWIFGVILTVAFCLLLPNCDPDKLLLCNTTSLIFYVFASVAYIIGLLTRPTDPINYLEMSSSKRNSSIRAFVEITIVIIALGIGIIPSLFYYQLYDINYWFAIFLGLFQITVFPLVCVGYIKAHISLIRRIKAIEVSTNVVSFGPSKQHVTFLDLPTDSLT
jgi:hypothetical protein